MKTTKLITILALGLILCLPDFCGAETMVTAFTYQGRLIDDNDVADGFYDFQFNLFNDPCAGYPVVGPVNEPGLDIIDGYFTVELDFNDPNAFNGDGRWLEIGVRDYDPCDVNAFTSLSPRQEITPAPYALYAASGPGVNDIPLPLVLSADIPSPDEVLSVTNTGTGNAGYFKADGNEARAVYGYASSTNSGINYGGYFEAAGEHGRGVYGYGSGPCAIGVQGYARNLDGLGAWGGYFSAKGEGGCGVFGYGEDNTVSVNYGGYFRAKGTNGQGVHTHASATSGINYGLYSTTDSNDGYAGYFLGGRNYFEGNVGIGTTDPNAKLEVDGDLKVTGAYRGDISSSSGNDGAPFPRPAYDSGWTEINAPQSLLLTHNIGGNVDNYVVDMQFKNIGVGGINQRHYGGEYSGAASEYGAWWYELTTTSIRVLRLKDDPIVDKVRVRIWVYN